MTAHAETHAHSHTIDALEDFAEFAYAHEWTDGLPVFPPTKKAVGAILDYLQRDPHEELGAIFPGDGIATIENVAANCAMAGCLPQYVPVVMAAVQCIADPALLITTTQSTGSASLCTIVSGAAVSKLKFHTREWVFGPNGGRANASIGRAVRLILWNIGRAHPGKLIKGTMGHPASWSYCIGEEQELNPWAPLHTDFGIAAHDSAVTVMKVGEHSQIAVPVNSVGLNEAITLLARNIGRLGITTSGAKRGFIWNQYSVTHNFWPRMERALEKLTEAPKVTRAYKTNTWTPLDKTKFDALADEVDYLVVGVGA